MGDIRSGANGQSVLLLVEEEFATILELAPTQSQRMTEKRASNRNLDRLKRPGNATPRIVVRREHKIV